MIKTFEEFTLNESIKNKRVILYDPTSSYSDALLDLTLDCIKSTIEILHELGGKIDFDSTFELDCGSKYIGTLELSSVEIATDETEGIEEICKNHGCMDLNDCAFTNNNNEGILLTTSDGKRLLMDAGDGFTFQSYFDLNEELLYILDPIKK